MEHEMKVQKECFKLIKENKKTIEPRLLDQKRKMFKKGQTIILRDNSNLSDSIRVEITAIKKFKSFNELVEFYPMTSLYNESTTKEEYLSILNKFYTKEEEQKFGVIAIELKLA